MKIAAWIFIIPLIFVSFDTEAQDNALNFDGTNDYINVGNDASIDNVTSGTIEAWIRTTDASAAFNAIFVNIPAYGLWVHSGNLITYDGGIETSGFFVADGDWHHVALTFTHGGAGQLYVDGAAAGASFTFDDVGVSTANLTIGENAVAMQYFQGDIDEIRIWNLERSLEEIEADMFNSISSAEGLVASYDFNSGTAEGTNIGVTTLTDITANSNDGTLQDGSGDGGASGFLLSGPTSNWVGSDATFVNYALEFDNTAEYVDLGMATTPDFKGDLTLEAWVNQDDVSGNNTLISKKREDAFELIFVGSSLQFIHGNGSTFEAETFGFTFAVDQWYHVSVTRNTNTQEVSLYVDGVFQETLSYTTAIVQGTENVRIGARFDNSQPFFGRIDEVRLWDKSRSGTEITADYNRSLNGDESGLLAYYTFSDGPGSTTLTDAAGVNNGTLINFETATDWVNGRVALDGVAPAAVVVTDPNGGESLSAGSVATITWDQISVAGSDVISIDLSTNGGATYTTNLASGSASTLNGTYDWTVTNVATTTARVQVSNTTQGLSDASDADFAIVRPFITTWQTTTASESITIPTNGSGYNYQVDWGDGNVVSGYTGDATHTYTTAGTYTVSVTGDFPSIYFNGGGDRTKIQTIEQWGDIAWTTMERAFSGCSSLTYNATDAPDLSSVTTFNRMFFGCSVFNGNINNWDVSGVTNFEWMFRNAPAYNQPMYQWVTSSVQVTRNMFFGATSFNQDISSWEMGGVVFANQMFSGATSFNQDISAWDVSSMTAMNSMFNGATSFDQNLGNWNISSASTLASALDNTAMSTTNYDATLVGWADDNGGMETVPSGITLGASGLTYTGASQEAREFLENTRGWTINGHVGLGVPTISGVFLVNIGGFSIDYTVPAEADDIQLQYDSDPNFSAPSTVQNIGTSGSAEIAASLVSGTQYYARIRAVFGSEVSDYLVSEAFYIAPENALQFDGIDDFISLARTPFEGGLTYEAWINTTSTDATSDYAGNAALSIIGDHDNNIRGSFGIHGGVVRYTHWTGTGLVFDLIDGSTPVNDGEWHHVAVVHNSSTREVTIYVDGVVDGTGTTSMFHTSVGFDRIGASYLDGTGSGDFFEGSLDEIRIWLILRTAEEIANNASLTIVAQEGLEAGFNFNQMSGGPTNILGFNDGTLEGAPTYVTSGGLTPIPFQASNASVNGFTANWLTIPTATDIRINIDTDSDLSDALFTDISITGPTGSSAFVAENLSAYIGQQLYYNIEFSSGTYNSPGSRAIAFMVAPGSALSFDGSDDFVALGDQAALDFGSADVFTIEAWINTANFAEQGIVTKRGNLPSDTYEFQTNTSGQLEFSLLNASDQRLGQQSTEVIADGTWRHVAVTYDGSATTTGIQLYIDGVLSTSTALSEGFSSSSGNTAGVALGAGNDSGGINALLGSLDEVRFWSKVLTQAEIASSRFRTLAGNEADLLAYYRFDEESTTTILPDLSTAGLDGTLTNMAGTEWTISGAQAPVQFTTSMASTNSMQINWQATNHGSTGTVVLEVNDASDFSGNFIFQNEIIGDQNGVENLLSATLVSGTRYYSRIYIQDGDFRSGFSNVIDFFPGAGIAMNFDGTNDYINLGASLFSSSDAMQPYTISAWIRTTGSGGIVTQYDDAANRFGIRVSNGVFRYWKSGANVASSTTSVNDGNWHHVAATRAADGFVQLYVDGVPDGTGTDATVFRPVNTVIGVFGPVSNTAYYTGDIDEVRIWNTERSQAEISSDMFATLTGQEADLIGYYRFDEGEDAADNTGITAPEIIDLSGGGSNGTLTNISKTGATSNWVASGALSSNAAPAAPTDLIVYRFNETELVLSWTDNSNDETRFTIEQADDFAFTSNVVQVDLVPVNSFNYVLNLGANSSGYFRINAVNDFGTSSSTVEFGSTDIHPGTSISFDGASQYLTVADDATLSLGADFTYAMWFKIDAIGTSAFSHLLSKRDGNDFTNPIAIGVSTRSNEGGAPGFPAVYAFTGDGSTGFTLITTGFQDLIGTWHHVAVTMEGTSMKIYLDGRLLGTQTFTGTRQTNDKQLEIGTELDYSSFFAGELDEIRIYNEARSDFSDRFTALQGLETGLVAYYSFEEEPDGATAENVLVDRSGNTNNATPVASPAFKISGAISPTNFVTHDVAAGHVDLLWTDHIDGETGYIVERASDANFTVSLEQTVIAANSTSHSFTGLSYSTSFLLSGSRTNR